jgi:hypothetical protein
VIWKREEREEEDDAAALRRIRGSGEAVRKEGNADVRDDGEVDSIGYGIRGHIERSSCFW